MTCGKQILKSIGRFVRSGKLECASCGLAHLRFGDRERELVLASCDMAMDGWMVNCSDLGRLSRHWNLLE